MAMKRLHFSKYALHMFVGSRPVEIDLDKFQKLWSSQVEVGASLDEIGRSN